MKIETIKSRLESLGYTYDETKDEFVIKEFLMPKVKNHILSMTNQTSIPKELQKLAVDRVCGEFLLAKKNSGQLVLDPASVTKELSSITEGKFTLNYAVNTSTTQSNDEKLDMLINYLMHENEGDLLCYRRLKW